MTDNDKKIAQEVAAQGAADFNKHIAENAATLNAYINETALSATKSNPAEHAALVSQYEQAYMEANHADKKAADANVTSMLNYLASNGVPQQHIGPALDRLMTDNLAALQQSAETANREANKLTPSVDNYAPAAGVTRIDAQSSTQIDTGASSLNLHVNQGFDAESIGLTRLAAHANINRDLNNNATSGGLGFTAVKALPEGLQPDGTTLFVAGGGDMSVNAKDVAGSATLLGVAASNLNGVPVGAYAGGAVDFKTGDITKVAHVEAMLNSDTNHPTTIGLGAATKNFDAASSSVNPSIYQQYQNYYGGLSANIPVNAPEHTAIGVQVGMQF